MNLLQLLESKGYKKHKWHNGEYIEWGKHDIISTMSNISFALILNNDVVWWGLHEFNKPLTLISPRPRIKVHRPDLVESEMYDDSMNICLQKETAEDIFKAMYDKSILFEYKV